MRQKRKLRGEAALADGPSGGSAAQENQGLPVSPAEAGVDRDAELVAAIEGDVPSVPTSVDDEEGFDGIMTASVMEAAASDVEVGDADVPGPGDPDVDRPEIGVDRIFDAEEPSILVEEGGYSVDDADVEAGLDADVDAEASLDADADLEAGLDAEVDAALDAGGVDPDPEADLSPAFTIQPARLKSILESLLFAGERPLSIAQLKQLSGEKDGAALQVALDALMEEYAGRGIVLHDVAGGYQFRTQPANSEYVQRLVVGRPVRLSRAQLETLAIVAYRQPITRPEIEEIRGVDSGSTLKVLVDRSLIRILGKKEEPGRPLIYGTSKDFLEFFNLRDLRELPTLREFHELNEESLRAVEEHDRREGPEASPEDEEAAASDHERAGDGAGDTSDASGSGDRSGPAGQTSSAGDAPGNDGEEPEDEDEDDEGNSTSTFSN